VEALSKQNGVRLLGKLKKKLKPTYPEVFTRRNRNPHIFFGLMIRHSASTVKRSSHPPGCVPFWIFPGGDCFCLRYLPSDESWRIALTQKTMEMDFCIVFCGSDEGTSVRHILKTCKCKAGYRRASFLWQVFMWQVLFARLYAQLWQFFLWQVHLFKS
jgi:hypothetical protein